MFYNTILEKYVLCDKEIFLCVGVGLRKDTGLCISSYSGPKTHAFWLCVLKVGNHISDW